MATSYEKSNALAVKLLSEAAVNGDTILIGPGEYGPYGPSQPSSCYGSDFDIYMNIQVASLTIIGSGKDSTIIGKTSDFDPLGPPSMGINLSGECGPRFAKIVGIGFRNLGGAVVSYPGSGDFPLDGSGVVVEDCRFENVINGVAFNGERNVIINCDFISNIGVPTFAGHVTGGQTRVVEIRNCRSEISDTNARHLSVGRVDSFIVADSHFTNNHVSGGAIGTSADNLIVSGCGFSGGSGSIGTRAVNNVIEGCHFSETDFGILFEDYPESVHVSNCRFEDMGHSSIAYFEGITSCTIYNCSLAKGERYAVQISPWAKTNPQNNPTPPNEPRTDRNGIVHFDMRHNYWGTDSPDSIQAWIEDRRDDPDWPIIVDFEPFKTGMVETRKSTLDAIKTRYR